MSRWLILSVVVLLLDQLTKFLASHFLVYGDPLAIMPSFNLTLLHNTGAAFSFLSDAGGWQRWFFSILALVVSIGLVIWMRKLRDHETWLAVALALILGGAVGNLVDRLLFGYVVDFIQVYYYRWYFPAFNVADSAISIGVAVLLLDSFRNRHKSGDQDNG